MASIPEITLYHAQGCHLCEKARDVRLEERYREWLPVVEIDGARAFVYYVDEAALRRKLSQT